MDSFLLQYQNLLKLINVHPTSNMLLLFHDNILFHLEFFQLLVKKDILLFNIIIYFHITIQCDNKYLLNMFEMAIFKVIILTTNYFTYIDFSKFFVL